MQRTCRREDLGGIGLDVRGDRGSGAAGLDKAVEIVLVAASPSRLTDLMTWF